MTGHDDFDRVLAGWFEAEAQSPAPAGGLGRVLDATHRRRPRPAWIAGPGSHWVGETPDASPGARSMTVLGLHWSTAVILLLALVTLLAGAVLVGAMLFQPSPTGRLGYLAYELGGDIYLADWDGKNAVRIADGDRFSDCATVEEDGQMWSPNGRLLAFRSQDVGCGWTVRLLDPEGHPVASFPGSAHRFIWSPDSTSLATPVDGDSTIDLYGIDGVRQAALGPPPGLPVDDHIVWSPDGKSVLTGRSIRLEQPVPEVWEEPVDGSTPRRLAVDDPRRLISTAFSPDGVRVAFVPYPDSYSLVIAEADGTELRVLPGAASAPRSGPSDGDYHQDPAWSPAGDRVAFIWSPPGPHDHQSPNTYELRVVDVASGTVTSLISAYGTDPLRVIRFSPEGDRILVRRGDPDKPMSLWSVRSDGSGAQLLVEGTGWGDWQWQAVDQ